VIWYLRGIRGELDMSLVLFSEETCFRCSGQVKSQNNNLPMFIQEVPSHVVVGAWCSTSARIIIEPFFI